MPHLYELGPLHLGELEQHLIFPAIAINHAAILLAIDIRGDLQVYRGTVLVVEAVEGRVVSVLILADLLDLDR